MAGHGCVFRYSGLVSEVPEKAATIAGEINMATKVRPIRKSCILVSPLGEVLENLSTSL